MGSRPVGDDQTRGRRGRPTARRIASSRVRPRLASWLALNGRRRRRVDPSGLRLAFGLPWVLPFVMGLDPAGSAAALVVAAGLTIWSARHWKPVATLDVTGVSTRHRGERRRIAWTDLRSVTVTHRRRHSFPKVVLELSDGTTTLWFEEHLDTMASIVTCASRVAAANTVVFEPAGPEPPPDTALSPARLTEAEAERGVSRVDEVRP